MPLIQFEHDDLSHVDPEPSAHARAAANELVRSELDPHAASALHPTISNSEWAPSFSSAIQELHENIAKSGATRVQTIDLTRYGEPAPPERTQSPDAWRSSLRNIHVAQTYLSGRRENLAALDKYGKNAWLLGNFQTENELRTYEQELKDARAQAQRADEESRQAQSVTRAEMDAMSESWQAALGRSIEAEVETEKIRRKCLELRKSLAR